MTDGISIQISAYTFRSWEVAGPLRLLGCGGTGKSGVPYKEGLIDIQGGTSDKREIVSEPVCFRRRPRTVALKGSRARYVLSAPTLTEIELPRAGSRQAHSCLACSVIR